MLAKKFALGFGIAIIFPLMVHYGVSTFSPQPKWQDYEVKDYYVRYNQADAAGKEKLREERSLLNKKLREHRRRFEKHLFFTAVPVGIAAIIFGSCLGIQALGAGLMFGGISTVMDGYAFYWSQLPDWLRFLSFYGHCCYRISQICLIR